MPNSLCRSCGAPLVTTFVDLGLTPLANAFIRPDQSHVTEPRYPLHAFVCDQCFLVQVEEFAGPEEIFTHYVYFSSYSNTWLDHCARYVEKIVPRLGLTSGSRIVEIASNDGALLRFFQQSGLDVLGIEPASNVAQVAIDRGVPTKVAFFNLSLALQLREMFAADLIVANNVLAHVPALNDFIAGLKALLAPRGTITIEFPHLARLISERQFDSIYHEHFSYFSLKSVEPALSRHGLALYDVEELPVHGGSLRLYVTHSDRSLPVSSKVEQLRLAEREAGLAQIETYRQYASVPPAVKRDVISFLNEARRDGKRVVGYGAAAKGNTLLNYCGVGSDHLDYVVDRNPHKQGLLLPGTHYPVYGIERIFETKPDYIFVLAWNLRDEILQALAEVRRWHARFVIPIPRLEVL